MIHKIKIVLALISTCILFGTCVSTHKTSGNDLNFEDRYALVIGNSDYINLTRLQNAKNDAGAVSRELEKLGFEVVTHFDLTSSQMNSVIEVFTDNLANNKRAIGLVYFAGQGVAINNLNYLIPVDLNAINSTGIISQSYSLETLFSKLLESNNDLNFVIMDTCFVPMTLPLAENYIHRGITSFPEIDQSNQPMINDGLDILEQFTNDIFYLQSALPGQIALDGSSNGNSPFTVALLNNISRPIAFVDLVNDIAADTMALTNRRQHPYFKANIFGFRNFVLYSNI